MGLLIFRRKIHMNFGILGSSDLDQSSPFAAHIMTNIIMQFFYPFIRDGKFKSRFLQNRLEKRKESMPEYTGAFIDMLGGIRTYITKKAVKISFIRISSHIFPAQLM